MKPLDEKRIREIEEKHIKNARKKGALQTVRVLDLEERIIKLEKLVKKLDDKQV